MPTFTEKNLNQLTATTLNHLIGSKAYVVLCNSYGTVRTVIPLESFCFKPTASNGITFNLPNEVQMLNDEVFNLLNDKFVPLFTAKVYDLFGNLPRPAGEINLKPFTLAECDPEPDELARLAKLAKCRKKLKKIVNKMYSLLSEGDEDEEDSPDW